jgi:hypothetical protein
MREGGNQNGCKRARHPRPSVHPHLLVVIRLLCASKREPRAKSHEEKGRLGVRASLQNHTHSYMHRCRSTQPAHACTHARAHAHAHTRARCDSLCRSFVSLSNLLMSSSSFSTCLLIWLLPAVSGESNPNNPVSLGHPKSAHLGVEFLCEAHFLGALFQGAFKSFLLARNVSEEILRRPKCVCVVCVRVCVCRSHVFRGGSQRSRTLMLSNSPERSTAGLSRICARNCWLVVIKSSNSATPASATLMRSNEGSRAALAHPLSRRQFAGSARARCGAPAARARPGPGSLRAQPPPCFV